MDTQRLIQESRARFKHNESKLYLTEKYTAQLTFAHGGGLWTATPELIGYLSSLDSDQSVVILDNYGNPVSVVSSELHTVMSNTYNTVMNEWFLEYSELKRQR